MATPVRRLPENNIPGNPHYGIVHVAEVRTSVPVAGHGGLSLHGLDWLAHVGSAFCTAPFARDEENQMQEYMRRMHERRAVEIAAVKEREVRRRRLMTEVDAAMDAEETAGRLSAVVEGLKRESAEEARIAARLKQLASEEDVLVSNRKQRMAQYTERREKDWAEAIAREVELSQALKVPAQTVP